MTIENLLKNNKYRGCLAAIFSFLPTLLSLVSPTKNTVMQETTEACLMDEMNSGDGLSPFAALIKT